MATGQGKNRPVWNNMQRLNHQNKFVPKAVLTKTGIFSVNTARQNLSSQTTKTSTARKFNTSRPIMNEIRPRNTFYKSYSPIRRPSNKSTSPKANFTNHKVNTARDKTVSAVRGYRETAVKASAAFTASSTSQPSNIHTTPVTEEAASMPHESPLQSVHLLGRDEGSLGDFNRNKLDLDAKISLVLPHDAEIQEKISSDTEVTTADTTLNTASVLISTSSATPEVSTTAANLVYIRRSAEKRKDKGKAIMIEDESVQKKSKKQLEQERLSHEEAIRLQEQINEEERKRIARDD
ncbi:hypothetical protein Tco_1160853 [Tanacetum coccineum]